MFESAKTAEAASTDKDSGIVEYPGSNLAQGPCIQYSIIFWKKSVLAFFYLVSKVNPIHPTFTKKLVLLIRPTDVGA